MEYIRSQSQIDAYFQNYNFQDYFGFDIRSYTSLVRFEADDIILQEGEPPSHLYFLLKGRAKLFITHKNGAVTLINFLKAPCFIGEMELLDQNRQANGVVALDTCLCFSIDIIACREKLLNDVTFLRNLCHILSDKALSDVSNYSKNQSYPLKVRLASFILMTEHNGIYRERHTEAAGFLGVTYRHLLYVLAEFVKEGLLEKSTYGYKIVQRNALESLAEQQ